MKRLVYVGANGIIDEESTERKLKLIADMGGGIEDVPLSETEFFVSFDDLGADSFSYNYFIPLIKGGTLEYYSYYITLGNYLYTINHGSGLKTHYMTNVQLKDTNGVTVLDDKSIGKSFSSDAELTYRGSSALEISVAIENNGKYINPRSLAILPNLYTKPSQVGFLRQFNGVKTPLSSFDSALVGDNSSPFAIGNMTLQETVVDNITLKKSFFDSIPGTLRNGMTLYLAGFTTIVVKEDDGSGELVDVYYRCARQLELEFGLIRITYRFRTGDTNSLNGIVVGEGSDVFPHILEGAVFTPDNFVGDLVIGNWYVNNPNILVYVSGGGYAAIKLHLNMFPGGSSTFKVVQGTVDGDIVIDEGQDYDKGGGNQNWGQGNPSTSTGGGTFDDSTDTPILGDASSYSASQSYNNYYVLDKKLVGEVKSKIWDLNIPIFTKPSEGIISLLSFPFDLTSRSTLGNVIKVGNSIIPNISITRDLLPNAPKVFSGGSIKLLEYFGGFQDYAPYTRISLYIPFVGYRELDPSIVQGKTINVVYVVNFTDGSALACVYVDNYLYQKHYCFVAQSVPLTQVDNRLLEATVSTAIQAGSTALVNPTLGLTQGVVGSLSNVANSRPSISHSVGGGGEIELSMPLRCFLRIERPDCAIAQTFNSEKGRPSLISKELSKCKGFTKMLDPKVKTSGTSEENDEVNRLLKEGVIINV